MLESTRRTIAAENDARGPLAGLWVEDILQHQQCMVELAVGRAHVLPVVHGPAQHPEVDVAPALLADAQAELVDRLLVDRASSRVRLTNGSSGFSQSR